MSNLESRLTKVEFEVGRLSDAFGKLDEKVSSNTVKLDVVLAAVLTSDKILKFVVTPLILIVGGLVGIKLVI